MTYLQHKDLKPEEFKRLCGVHQETFTRMVSVFQEQVEQKKKKPGKPSKLSVEDQVLMSLE
jgi:predicted transcriptional regulator